jgi:ABC-type multidrug transport system fused ATPase/permease subunit
MFGGGIVTAELRTNAVPPGMLIGTLRQILDPFEAYDDAISMTPFVLLDFFPYNPVRKVPMRSFRLLWSLALDTLVSSGGSDISVGQRQIIALARALVRGSELIIQNEGITPHILHEGLF